MFQQTLRKCIFVTLVFPIFSSCNNPLLMKRVKRTDIDLTTCIDNFDIHKDKIIRTQDSQKMGAKYLNEIDLGSKEECLRLCCETDNCDVFVYEDKNSGSCYLFHCGPPEDFKCKFTHHVNYSSAILAINRHIPDLESQIKLTKHEQDLTKLRKSDVTAAESLRLAPGAVELSPPIITSTTVKSKEVLPEQSSKIEEKKCSRYQFECHSTRECIAIYNACDGIPQCADASDEAPELGCPEPSTPPPTPHMKTITYNNPQPAALNTIDKNLNPSKNQDETSNIYNSQQIQPDITRDNTFVPHGNADFLRPIPEQRIPQRPPHYPETPEYNPQIPQLGWSPHQTAQIPYQLPPASYPDKASHIFNHKENGLQVPEAEISQYQDVGNYPKVSQNYYGDVYRPLETPNWLSSRTQDDQVRYPVRYNQDPSSYLNNYKPMEVQQTKYIPAQKIPNWPGTKENPEHIQVKMAHELKNSKVTQDIHNSNNIEDPKIKIVEKNPEPKSIDYPDVVAYKIDGNDGVARTPGGAVLSLTFGLIITCIMAIMIGCRLRIVKRRIRKGGKGYSHDADYLVNGMYL